MKWVLPSGPFVAAALIRQCAALPDTAPTDAFTAARYTLRRLAQRIQALTAEERELQRHITAVLNTYAPQLLQHHGVGPDSASALLVTAGDNPDRVRGEASFAALCGVSPSRHHPARPAAADSTAAATDTPTPPSTASP